MICAARFKILPRERVLAHVLTVYVVMQSCSEVYLCCSVCPGISMRCYFATVEMHASVVVVRLINSIYGCIAVAAHAGETVASNCVREAVCGSPGATKRTARSDPHESSAFGFEANRNGCWSTCIYRLRYAASGLILFHDADSCSFWWPFFHASTRSSGSLLQRNGRASSAL